MNPFKNPKRPPINFTLRVIATDYPVDDVKNFKVKLAMDLIPEFEADSVYSRPNFNGKRVAEILQFISDDVIRKVIEYVNYDRSNEHYPENQGENFARAMEIYDERRALLKKAGNDRKKQEEIKSMREDEIEKIVGDFMNNRKRMPGKKERNVSSVRFEHFSPGELTVSVDTVVNGEKKLPR